MSQGKNFFQSPFGSALLGAVIAVVIGIIVIATGLVNVDNSNSHAVAAGPSTFASNTKSTSGSSKTIEQIYNEDAQGVAFIQAQEKPGSTESPLGLPSGGGVATGSGILIDDDGHVLTNDHVVANASSITVKFGDNSPLPAKVLGTDTSTDIAVLSVDPSKVDAKPLVLGNSKSVRVGDAVVAIGNPYGLDNTVTSGIVSALQRQISAPNGFTISNVIQTDASINPGNSGGPLINAEGQVIGINSQIATGPGGGEGSVGIGFAIPIDTAKSIADQIVGGDTVQHAFLGIAGADVTPQLAKALNLNVDEGVLVQKVTANGPAADAGVKGGDKTVQVEGVQVRAGGDVITAVDGNQISGMDDLISIVNGKQPGDEITLTVQRGGSSHDITVKLGNRPQSAGG